MNYGRALKTLREVRQLKQKDLADRAALDAGYVSQIESGKKVPSTTALEAIAQALGVPMHLLMLFASEAHDLKGLSEPQARELEIQLLSIVLKSEKNT